MNTIIDNALLEDNDMLVDCNGTLWLVHSYYVGDDIGEYWSAWPAVKQDITMFSSRPADYVWGCDDRNDLVPDLDYKTADEVLTFLRENFDRVEVLT